MEMKNASSGPLRVGVAGPVGSGKTALMDALCKGLREHYDIAVVTNDIYTKEDAQFLIRSGALPEERIVGVEPGGCPHAGASLVVMDRDARKHLGDKPYNNTNNHNNEKEQPVLDFIIRQGLLRA